MTMPAGPSVAEPTVGTHRPADEVVDLVARRQEFTLPPASTSTGTYRSAGMRWPGTALQRIVET
jgi:hypothetical protein